MKTMKNKSLLLGLICQITRTGSDPRYDVCVNPAANVAKVIVPKVEFKDKGGATMSDGYRVGISTQAHDRKQNLSAVVTPASYSVNVEIVGDTKLTVSHPTDQSGTIKFDLVGKTKSDQASDAILKAQLKTGKTELAKVGLSVVVPGKIGTPHPNFNGAVSGVNRVLDATTSPAVPNLPTGYVFLATTYGTILSVQVTDQFDHNLDEIYDVSIVPPGTLQIFW